MSNAKRLSDLWQLHTERRALEAKARADGLTLHAAKRLLAVRATIARHERDCGEPIGAVVFA